MLVIVEDFEEMEQKTVVYKDLNGVELKKKIDEEYSEINSAERSIWDGVIPRWYVHELVLLSNKTGETKDYLIVYRKG